MAPRPKNPPPDRRADILAAALRVFGQHGYSAATNAQIAREAGVTPAALYYYFPSKEDLFLAAVSDRRRNLAPIIQQIPEHLADMEPQVVLTFAIRQIIQFISEERTHAVLRILLAEGPRNPALVRIWEEQVVGEASMVLLRYLQSQMEAGRIRQMDPRIIAMMLLGPVMMATMTRDVLGVNLVQDLSDEELAQQLTEVLLPGLFAFAPMPEKE